MSFQSRSSYNARDCNRLAIVFFSPRQIDQLPASSVCVHRHGPVVETKCARQGNCYDVNVARDKDSQHWAPIEDIAF